MKATGIVRRVDDLGRIVIPKEIRRTLKIREGDPLEIYTEKDGGVIFRKYSPMGDLQDFAVQICESIGANTGHVAAVADRDSIIALSGAPKRDLMDKPNSQELDKLMQQRKNYRYMPGDAMLRVSEGSEKYHLGVAAPILSLVRSRWLITACFSLMSCRSLNVTSSKCYDSLWKTASSP